MPTLLWFRRDLRLHDLPPLLDAAAADGEVLACYVLDPRLKASSGPRRLQYLYDALRELREQPRRQAAGDPWPAGEANSRAGQGDRRDVGARVGGLTRRSADAATTPSATRSGDVPLEESGSPYLVSPGRVTKGDGTPYKVFTPFYDAWRRHGWRRPAEVGPEVGALDRPGRRRRAVSTSPTPGSNSSCPPARRRPAGNGRSSSTDGLDDYADDRNRPDLDATSRMSAHLKFGTIHPRTMAADLGSEARARRRTCGSWRSATSTPRCSTNGPTARGGTGTSNFDAIAGRRGRARRSEAFEAWKAGRTGFPIVDAGMRQLAETGLMHNRVRMIVASFLVKDLHLPWQWGARWFLEQLVDGDMANNQHGWQWAAGCGTDAAPYFRVFNPTTQGEKFDPDGDYVRRWVPEVDDDDYPEPIVDHKAERAEALRRYSEIG